MVVRIIPERKAYALYLPSHTNVYTGQPSSPVDSSSRQPSGIGLNGRGGHPKHDLVSILNPVSHMVHGVLYGICYMALKQLTVLMEKKTFFLCSKVTEFNIISRS